MNALLLYRKAALQGLKVAETSNLNFTAHRQNDSKNVYLLFEQKEWKQA